jgi:Zn-finger nucleic acid-binding protein
MRRYARGGLIVELCEDCRGMFLDQGELERLIEAEGGGWSGIVSEALDANRPTRP